MRELLTVGGVAAVAFIAWIGSRSRAEAPPPGVAAAPAAEAVASRVEPVAAPLAPANTQECETADATSTLLLPDGSRVAALNGARSPRAMSEVWPTGVPWSPITGVERSPAGIDWFVHADGSRSTTQMVWRADLGRMDAMTRLARPTPRASLPVAAKD
jgi:hypothetical protein